MTFITKQRVIGIRVVDVERQPGWRSRQCDTCGEPTWISAWSLVHLLKKDMPIICVQCGHLEELLR